VHSARHRSRKLFDAGQTLSGTLWRNPVASLRMADNRECYRPLATTRRTRTGEVGYSVRSGPRRRVETVRSETDGVPSGRLPAPEGASRPAASTASRALSSRQARCRSRASRSEDSWPGRVMRVTVRGDRRWARTIAGWTIGMAPDGVRGDSVSAVGSGGGLGLLVALAHLSRPWRRRGLRGIPSSVTRHSPCPRSQVNSTSVRAAPSTRVSARPVQGWWWSWARRSVLNRRWPAAGVVG